MEELKTCSLEAARKWVEQEIHDYCTDGMLVGSEIEAVAALTCIRDELYHRAAPENKALALKQLKSMLSCPIWIENGCSNEYAIIYEITENCIRARSPNADYTLSFIGQGKSWKAYARKPEGSKSHEIT